MLNIKIICVGKLKEKHYADAAAEYVKRLGPLCRLEVEELPESRLPSSPGETETAAALKKEAESIMLRIPSGAVVAALCIEGSQMDSTRFSKFLEMCAVSGKSKLCFIIGGSFGLSDAVKRRADRRLSVSEMTFPHQLFRVMLLEQIYRAKQIERGSKYHK